MFDRLPKRALGLALSPRAIHIVQMALERSGPRLLGQAVFPCQEGADWEHPQALGAKLAEFLRAQKITARGAFVGLPGRWLLLKPRLLPPVTSEAAASILRLAVQREFAVESQEWVFDYHGQADPAAPSSILLGAMSRARLDQVRAALSAAGLHVLQITSTSAALVAQVSIPDAVVLLLDAEGGELAVRAGGKLMQLDRLTAPLTSERPNAALTGEIRRMLASARTDPQQRPLVVWDATDQSPASWAQLAGELGLTERINPDMAGMGVDSAQRGAAAVALAGWQSAGGLDFAHSRLAAAATGFFTRPRKIGAGALLALLLLAGVLGGDWLWQSRAVAGLEEELKRIAPTLKTAQEQLDRVNLARGWFDRRPALLDTLRAITLALPNGGRVWVTNLTLRDDLAVTLAGKALDEKSAVEFLDKLRASGRLRQVKLLYLRQAERGEKTVSFALTFLDQGPE